MKKELLDKTDRYLRDEMSASEKKAFEKVLEADATLREEVELQRMMVSAVETRIMKERLAGMERRASRKSIGWRSREVPVAPSCTMREPQCFSEPVEQECATVPMEQKKRDYRKWALWSAVAACLLGCVFFFFRETEVPMDNPSSLENLRGASSLTEVEQLMEQKRYGTALHLMDSLEQELRQEHRQLALQDSLSAEETYRMQADSLALQQLGEYRARLLDSLNVWVEEQMRIRPFQDIDRDLIER